MSKSLPARAMAAKALAAVCNGESLARALPAQLEDAASEQRPFIQELVYGSLREWPRLAAIARQLLRKPLRSKDHDIHALIMLGLHQLSSLSTPDHAAVGETVAATRSLGKSWATGLVNGCLRSYQRDAAELESRLTTPEQLALPDWFWQSIDRQWPGQAATIAAASRSHPPLTLRCNRSRISPELYHKRLTEAGCSAHFSAGVATAITLDPPRRVEDIPGFADGLSSVQDASAQLAAQFLEPQDGESILDACAAPGGKTCHLLEWAPGAKVLATDNNEQRLDSVAENARRLGLTPEMAVLDASCADTVLAGRAFDAILADVPCSATGVMRRNPDIKITRSWSDIEGFAKQQRSILAGLWPLLRPGGRLLYVTCSVLGEENDDVIAAVRPDLDGCSIAPLTSSAAVETKYGLQTLPCQGGGDGLYFSLLVRNC